MVSIIIPVFNKKGTISKCLDSILNNDYKDREIIVVDDASNDGSLEILKEYSKKGIILIELPENRGVSQACNVALAIAKGDIIIRTDADTVVPKDWISRFVKYFENQEIVAVGGASYGCLNQEDRIARLNSIFVKIGEIIFRRPFLFGRLPGANRAVRKSLFELIGGFSRDDVKCEDRSLFFRIKNKGKIIFDPTVVVKTSFPSKIRELWHRKFLWGQGEGEAVKFFLSVRLYFSFFIIISSIGILLIAPLVFLFDKKLALSLLLVPMAGYMIIFLLGCAVSLKEDKINWVDYLYVPFVLVFSEIAFFLGAIKGAVKTTLFKKG